MGTFKLRSMFLALLTVLFVAAIVANYFWTSYYQQEQLEKELVEKGEVLSQQMDAVWSFMSLNQRQLEKIAYTDEGVYRGLHCAIAGRTIGMLFSQSSDYTTRFVNFEPRNLDDTPDEFEAAALEAFYSDSSVKQYYAFTELEDKQVFRYSAPMLVEETCLTCHGEPAGEIDVVGFAKEGWKLGEVGGAISIVMPLDLSMENQRTTIIYNIIFFAALLLIFSVIIWFALTRLVTSPLQKIQGSIKEADGAEIDIQLSKNETSREIRDFAEELHSLSAKLAEVYNNLEAQVADRTTQLTKANDLLVEQRSQLERVNSYLEDQTQYKSDFLAMMSHELKTPLTSIIAFAGLLKKTATCQGDEDLADISREIESSSNILLTIINDILDMSRIEAGKAELNIELVDLGDLMSGIKSFIQPIAEQKKIHLRYEVKGNVPLVFVDADKLHHIIVNLLSNAIKFTAEGGDVSVKVSLETKEQTDTSQPADASQYLSVAQNTDDMHTNNRSRAAGSSNDTDILQTREAKWILIEVRDTGIGIATEDQKDIFERFWQVDSSSVRSYSGTGIGLALVKEYAEMHDGSVTVQSKLGEGSTFSVRILARQEKPE